MKHFFAIAGIWMFAVAAAHAGSLDSLKVFLTQAKSLKANFEQTVSDSRGKVIQQSAGNMQFARPGKFRWEYQKPYKQLVVGDGEKLWLYDPELNQATVRKLDQAIGSSPAALLAGDAEIEKNFKLKDAGVESGLNWVEATPKSSESTFEHVRMGFNETGLAVLQLKDNFGQTTVITLANVQLNGKFPQADFRFVPPKGADVITD
ncbi:MAG: outer membrane lipoprotein chaperone LolA [Burkholderiales bacterium]|nr:outer membrane lipoprotein chaperone LolA [Burkholderiales bacterium]